MSDHFSDNDSHYGKNDIMSDLNDMHINIIETTGAIQLPHTTRRTVFSSNRNNVTTALNEKNVQRF